jgi:DNA-binding winged helix-turn-helix (wHTH) protein
VQDRATSLKNGATIRRRAVPYSRTIYRFGPYELDPMGRSLLENHERLVLPDRQFDVLICLVASAGKTVHKDDLHRGAWGRVDVVGDNSIVMAVKGLRDALGKQPDTQPYIVTVIRKGYRFIAPVEAIARGEPGTSPDAIVLQHEAFITGRAAVESLNLDEVESARQAFATALSLNPRLASAHKGMQVACFLGFEATRATREPDVAQLTRAEDHGQQALALDPTCNHTWGMLALVHHRRGNARRAVIEARTALSFDKADWMDYLRLAAVSWGNERLYAAQQARSGHPRLAHARWLAASVHVARGAFDHALDEIRPGCALQDQQWKQGGRYSAVGLHWLHGLVLAAKGDVEGAVVELERELATADERHVHGRESIANTHYALGALRVRQCRRDEAMAAFREALKALPGHPLATIGLYAGSTDPACVSGGPLSTDLLESDPFDRACATAVLLSLQQRHEQAAGVIARALAHAPPGSAGWLLPVEPLSHVTARPDVWASALGQLADRAI